MRIPRASNDNTPTDAWIIFRNSKNFWIYAKNYPELCWAQKVSKYHGQKERNERMARNFIYFMEFELRYENEIQKNNK